MVRFMAMVLPAVVSVCFLEYMEGKERTVFQYLKVLARHMLWINVGAMLVCHYIMKVTDSIYDSFASNIFLIHYLTCSIAIAILLPIMKYMMLPKFSISIKKKEQK